MNRDDTTRLHLKNAVKTLGNAGIPLARNEITQIISHFFSIPRYRAVTGDFRLSSPQWQQFQKAIQQRSSRIPLQYILGSCSFWKHEFTVTPDVLIPRPETEHLVETALNYLPKNGNEVVVDCCTGSGCVAISLAWERPNTRVIGCDISSAALKVAEENRTKIGVDNCSFLTSDMLQSLKAGSVDIITANPPYVSPADAPSLEAELSFEPAAALFSQKNGLNHIRTLLRQAPEILKKNGCLMFEFGYNQGEAVRKLAENDVSGRIRQFTIIKDLNGYERIGFLRYA
ncbi:MAG: peptide chain release factor N(5)-glutamine methyltransferase [Acidobacteria bacterium]|nr:peptide chain release factor N(5)-glutamine methyltransferase [Acidobacteriota bacterium]